MSDGNTVTTADGVFVGVDAPTAPRPAPTAPPALPTPPRAPDARFTAEDIAKARAEEKSKVYGRLETLQEQVNTLASEREARLAAETDQTAAAEAAERAKRESEMDIRSLLEQKEQEFNEKIARLEQEREAERALRLKEQEYTEFLQYRHKAIAAAQDDILPELIDFVQGNSPQEIEASIAGLRDRSAQIMNNTTEALAAARRDQRGVQSTGLPLAGPLDNESGNQSLTPEQISGMSLSEYAANRGRLGVTGAQTGRGLFS